MLQVISDHGLKNSQTAFFLLKIEMPFNEKYYANRIHFTHFYKRRYYNFFHKQDKEHRGWMNLTSEGDHYITEKYMVSNAYFEMSALTIAQVMIDQFVLEISAGSCIIPCHATKDLLSTLMRKEEGICDICDP